MKYKTHNREDQHISNLIPWKDYKHSKPLEKLMKKGRIFSKYIMNEKKDKTKDIKKSLWEKSINYKPQLNEYIHMKIWLAKSTPGKNRIWKFL